jgi:hypothetical protein
MKWVTLLKDIKEKVGLTQSPSPSSSPATTGAPPPSSSPANSHNASSSTTFHDFPSSPSRFFFSSFQQIYFCIYVFQSLMLFFYLVDG